MLLLVLGIGAVLFLIFDFGGVHFGVDTRDNWTVDPTNVLGVNAIRRNLR
jgi:hypothetical protein